MKSAFLIYRYGSNSANQPMTEKMAVGIVDADDAADAKRIAEENFTRYANQFFGVIPQAEMDAEDDSSWDSILTRNAELESVGEPSIVIRG